MNPEHPYLAPHAQAAARRSACSCDAYDRTDRPSPQHADGCAAWLTPAHYLWSTRSVVCALYCDTAYLGRLALDHLGFGDFALLDLPGITFARRDGTSMQFPAAFVGRPHRVVGPVEAVEHLHDAVLATGNVLDLTGTPCSCLLPMGHLGCSTHPWGLR